MSYTHILARCLGEPLNIEQSKLEVLTSEVFIKLMLDASQLDRSEPTPPTVCDCKPPKNTVVIPVHNSLVNKNGAGASGVTSYSGIRNRINGIIMQNMGNSEEAEEKIENIIFDISSGGGESAGNFPLTDLIKSLPTKYGIKTYAFSDSTAASAAYAIMAACEKAYCVDTANIGSIGTIMSLIDVTKADEKNGVKYTILRSKEHKAGYNPHEVASEEVINEAQALLKVWDDKFNSLMLSYRPKLTMETLTKLDGRTVTGVEAVELGLADKIVETIEDVFSELHSLQSKAEAAKSAVTTQFPSTYRGNTTMNLEEALNEVVRLKSENETLKASATLDLKQAVQEERQRTVKVLEAQSAFGVSAAMALNAISKGYSLDMVTDLFTEAASNKAESTAVTTTSPAPTSAAGSVDAVSLQHIASLGSQQTKAESNILGGGVFGLNDLVSAMAEIGAENLAGAQ